MTFEIREGDFVASGSFSGSGCAFLSLTPGGTELVVAQHGASDWAGIAAFSWLVGVAGEIFGSSQTAEDREPVYGPACADLFESAADPTPNAPAAPPPDENEPH